jgi:protein TonB
MEFRNQMHLIVVNPLIINKMKTQEPIAAQMDEIVFEHRNKSYGAYILRKMYKKQLTRALFIASAVMIAGLAYPVVSSYKALNQGRFIIDDGPVGVFDGDHPPIDPPVLPPAPPPIDEVQKHVVFTAPEVVEGEIPEGEGLPFIDDIIKNSTNEPVNIDYAPVTTTKEVVIETEDNQLPPPIVEEMPTYPGGETERIKFLSDQLVYPQQALETGIRGTVYVQFIIDSKGNITDVKVLRGIGGGCDEEAIRVIKLMPAWHPGKQNGRAVRVLYNMPVVFKLQS